LGALADEILHQGMSRNNKLEITSSEEGNSTKVKNIGRNRKNRQTKQNGKTGKKGT
jgi:hypothetical protein